MQGATWIWEEVKTWRFWSTALFALAIIYIVVVVRPFSAAPPTLSSDEVSLQWNESIARLGIQAVYPLQEDFQAGDIWAIVAVAPGKPILGKSVRIGHINLKPYITDVDRERPIFANTKELDPGATVRLNDRFEAKVSDDDSAKLSTAIAAFPTITINHTTKSSIGAALAQIGIGGSRAGQLYEQINLVNVETYGAPALESYALFQEWCGKEETKPFCIDDGWARRLLAVAVSPDVMEVDPTTGQYTSQIELRLVTRVFMTRQIETRRWIVDSSGAAVDVTGDGNGAVPTAPVAPPAAAGPNGVPVSSNAATATAPSPSSPGIGQFRTQWSNESEIGLKGVFQRPLVFGFRSIRNVLKLSKAPSTQLSQPSSATNTAGK
jgi:hypothetical protein